MEETKVPTDPTLDSSQVEAVLALQQNIAFHISEKEKKHKVKRKKLKKLSAKSKKRNR